MKKKLTSFEIKKINEQNNENPDDLFDKKIGTLLF